MLVMVDSGVALDGFSRAPPLGQTADVQGLMDVTSLMMHSLLFDSSSKSISSSPHPVVCIQDYNGSRPLIHLGLPALGRHSAPASPTSSHELLLVANDPFYGKSRDRDTRIARKYLIRGANSWRRGRGRSSSQNSQSGYPLIV